MRTRGLRTASVALLAALTTLFPMTYSAEAATQLTPAKRASWNPTQFLPALRGAVSDRHDDGWPFANDTQLDRLAAAGMNLVHFRTGPYGPPTPSCPDCGTYGVGDALLGPLTNRVAAANARGIHVEVDLIDYWAVDAFGGENLAPGYTKGCAQTQSAPSTAFLTWVQRVVEHTREYAVIYNLGNEPFRCGGMSYAWELAIFNKVKQTLATQPQFGDRLVGATFNLYPAYASRQIVQNLEYQAFHGFYNDGTYSPPTTGANVPALLNEADEVLHTPSEWQNLIVEWEKKGAYVMVWRNDLASESDYVASMQPLLGTCAPLPTQPLRFHPVTNMVTGQSYCRLLDTRTSRPSLRSGQPYAFQVAGRVGCPDSSIPLSARAIAANLIALQPTAPGYLTTSRRCSPVANGTSMINFDTTRNARSGNAILPLSGDGRIAIQAQLAPSGTMEFVLDITGYYSDVPNPNTGDYDYTPLASPVRLVDSQLVGGQASSFTAPWSGGGRALAGNATLVSPSGAGDLFLYPHGAPLPSVGHLNYVGGEVVGNGGTVGANGSGTFTAYATRSARLLYDVMGSFVASGTTRFHPLNPCRLPTMSGYYLPAGTVVTFTTKGYCGIPSNATAIALTASVIPSAQGFLAFWATGQAWGGTGNLNYNANQNTSNSTIVAIGPGATGELSAKSAAALWLYGDVTGYFSAYP